MDSLPAAKVYDSRGLGIFRWATARARAYSWHVLA